VVGSFPVKNDIAQLNGSWHLELADSITRSVNLTLFQSSDVIFGTGSMTSGNVIQEVAAYGSVAGSKLNLELISMSDINLFQLSLDLKMPSVSGSYKALSANNATWTGTATRSVSA
jgi:citrate lyase synthetase